MQKVQFQRHDIEFDSKGTTCRGWYYQPVTREDKAPSSACILMAHGLGGTVDSGLSPYAERFASSGFHVIVFDYRYFGKSDGMPRQLLTVANQLEDWRFAIDYARTMPQIHPNQIGLWGTSFSGGHVVTIAAQDNSIKAICAQNPMLDGMASVKLLAKHAGLLHVIKLSLSGIHDIIKRKLGMPPVTVPVVGISGQLSAISNTQFYDDYIGMASETWVNSMTAGVTVTLPFYRPISYANKISCKVLLQPCMLDTVVSPSSAVTLASKLGPLATLCPLTGMNHFDLYEGEGFEDTVTEQVRFFTRSLFSPS